MTALSIRTMRPEEIALAVDWAAAEGWNPGLGDAACFATVDPGGFLIGELDGAPAATISCLDYDARFAFLGFYIVRPDLRGQRPRPQHLERGHRARGRARHRPRRRRGAAGELQEVGLQARLRQCALRRHRRRAARAAQPMSCALSDIPFAAVEADDATVFPAPRAAFLRAWIAAPGHIGRALLRDGRLAAWGVIRPCRTGRKIGPLVADDRAAAETVLSALLAAAGGGEVFLDVPSPNRDAVALAESLGLAPVFETARMYTGAIPPLRLDRLFGVTTFELG